MIKRQIKMLTPAIYRIAKRTNRVTSPPPKYQMYCAFSPLNSIGLLIPLFIWYMLFAIFESRLNQTPKKLLITVATTTRNTQEPNQAAATLPVS